VKNVAVIKFNRLDALNAINDQFIADLVAALDEAEKDKDVRSVVIGTAHDKVFCTGADLKMAQALLATPDKVKILVEQGQKAIDKIATLTKPVIAAIHGLCLGGGTEIALACDIRIADEEAKIGTPEVGLGLFPAWGGCVRMPRIIGMGKAMEIIMTGRLVAADEALRIGLAERVVPSEDFESELYKFCDRVANTSPLGNRAAKKIIRSCPEMSGRAARVLSDALRELVGASEDAREGMAAHLEGRPPKYKAK